MSSAINWFEIPAADFNRAVRFYGDILGEPLRVEEFAGQPNGFFSGKDPGVNGSVVCGANYTPSANGTVVYLNAKGDLDGILSRVEAAGGRIVLPKTSIAPQGHIALLIDTEGNKVGLHEEPTE